MPNELIKPKGEYEVIKLNRHPEQRRSQWKRPNVRLREVHHINRRKQWITLTAYYCLLNVFLTIFTIAYFSLHQIFHASEKPCVQKLPSLSCAPGIIVGDLQLVRYKENIMEDINPLQTQIGRFMEKLGIEAYNHLKECNLDRNWGYHSGTPCVILKLNQAYNFRPITYDDAGTLPSEAPDELYDHVLELSEEERKERIWVACEHKEDKKMKLHYVPDRFYSAYGLFNQANIYLKSIPGNNTKQTITEYPAHRRLLGIKFVKLRYNNDTLVTCRVWAKNIPLERGTVRLLIRLKNDQYGNFTD